MRFSLLILVLTGLLMPALSQPKIPPSRPKIIVGLVVQDMRFDFLSRYWDQFGSQGFRRMAAEGCLHKNARYDHLLLRKSTGHASLSTGAQPSVHGIISDGWYDRNLRRIIGAVEDPARNPGDPNGWWAGNLLSSTFADELLMSNQRKSKVVSISADPEAAILMAGHITNRVYWFDPSSAGWTGYKVSASGFPQWLLDFNQKKLPDLYLSRFWNTLEPIREYTGSMGDTVSFESGFEGGLNTFPYDLKSIRGKDPGYSLLMETPFGNTFHFDFALENIVQEQLGKDEYCDILLISLPAIHSIARRFGPASVEMEDAMLRLDRELASFLQFLDQQIGLQNALVFLSSDKGASYSPEYLKQNRIPAEVFNLDKSILLLRGYLNATLGPGDWIEKYHDQQFYLNLDLIEKQRSDIQKVEDRIAHLMVQFSGLSHAQTASNLKSRHFPDGVFSRMQHNFHHNRSGEVILGFAPGWAITDGQRKTANGGSGVENQVPLMWFGWKMRQEEILRPVSMISLAPTISLILGIPPPNGSDGFVIGELFD